MDHKKTPEGCPTGVRESKDYYVSLK